VHNISKYHFYDKEDGSVEKLKIALILQKEASGARHKEWLIYSKETLQLIGLAMEAGVWSYQLSATDRAGENLKNVFFVFDSIVKCPSLVS